MPAFIILIYAGHGFALDVQPAKINAAAFLFRMRALRLNRRRKAFARGARLSPV